MKIKKFSDQMERRAGDRDEVNGRIQQRHKRRFTARSSGTGCIDDFLIISNEKRSTCHSGARIAQFFAKSAKRVIWASRLLPQKGKKMKVQDVMTYDVQTCGPETNLATAAMQMWKGDFGVMPVVTAGKVIGMITDRDICMAAATKHRDPANIRVKEVISGEVYGCSADTDIHEALKIMRKKQVRRLPIISAEDGSLQGILSMNDVALKAQDRAAQRALSAQDVENTLKSDLRASHRCRATSIGTDPVGAGA